MFFLDIIFTLSHSIALFSGLALVPLFMASALICITCNYQKKTLLQAVSPVFKQRSLPATLLFWSVTTALVYMLASTIWSLDTSKTFFSAAKIVGLIAALYFCIKSRPRLKPTHHTRLGFLLLIGMLTATILAITDMATHGIISGWTRFYDTDFQFHPSQLNRGSVYLGLCVWPLVFFLYHQKRPLLALCAPAFVIVTVFFMDSLTSALAMLAAVLTFFACFIFKKHAIYLVTAILAVGILATPVTSSYMDPSALSGNQFGTSESSIKHRLHIWSFTAKKALEKPLFGWGVEGSRTIPITPKDAIPENWGAPYVEGQPYERWKNGRKPHPLPLHPHNGTLQIWLELGSIGLALYIAIVILSGITLAHSALPRMAKCSSVALFTHYITLQQTGFGAWQNWLWCAGLLAALIIYLAMQPVLKKTA